MKTIFFFLSVVCLVVFTACFRNKSDKPHLKKNDALIIGNPFDYGMDNILIFPVGSNYKPVVYENRSLEINKLTPSSEVLNFTLNSGTSFYDRTAKEEYINTDEDRFDIRNILFYDLKTNKTYPLVMDTLHILSFAMHKEFAKPMIFYRVVKNDYNKDSVFNSQDPVMLFVSDLYGRDFKQITPANEQFIDYTYYAQTQTILIKTILDSDTNKYFTSFDETNFREMKIDEPAMAREIFKKSLKDSLRIQLKTQ